MSSKIIQFIPNENDNDNNHDHDNDNDDNMILENKLKQTCIYCNKQFKRKRAYQEHELFCKELHHSKYIRQTDEFDKENIPSVYEIYTVMRQLMTKFQNQQKQIDSLKRQLKLKEQKLDVIKWLNQNQNDITIHDCISIIQSYTISEVELNLIFDSSVTNQNINSNTYSTIFTNIFNTYSRDSLSIQCFYHKINTLFIRDVHNTKWKEVQNIDLDNIIRIFHNMLLSGFTHWRKNNQSKIDTDQAFYDNIFLPRLQKILNLNITYKHIKSSLYHALKQDSSCIQIYHL